MKCLWSSKIQISHKKYLEKSIKISNKIFKKIHEMPLEFKNTNLLKKILRKNSTQRLQRDMDIPAPLEMA